MAVRWATIRLEDRPIQLRLDTSDSLNLNIVGNGGQTLQQGVGPDEVRIDARVQALGSNSCGPLPLERYRLYTDPFDFTFTLRFQG